MSQAGEPLAEWWKRLVAYILDALIIGIPAQIIFQVAGIGRLDNLRIDPATGLPVGLGAFFTAIIVASLAYQVVYLIYFAVLNGGESGQTLGKKVMNIRVRKDTGGPIGIGAAAGRYLINTVLTLLCLIPGLLDVLWPLWDTKRQALHDKVVNSVVVNA